MNVDMAQRLAATAVDGVTVDDAKAIIRSFIVELLRCPVCNDTGSFTYQYEASVHLVEQRGGSPRERRIPEGTIATCPRCGGIDSQNTPRGDPEFVLWHCLGPDHERRCSADMPGESERHVRCGYRVMIPRWIADPD